MTEEEAILFVRKELRSAYKRAENVGHKGKTKYIEVLEMTILEQEPKTDVLDKIRAEIEQIEIHGNLRDVECFSAGINAALDVIDKYRVESEGEK